MPQIRTQTVDPKMYRHFAVVTVAITLTLAVFVEGEGREALASEVSAEIAERQEANRVKEAEVAKFGQAKLVHRAPLKHRDVWANDDGLDSSYGQPMDRVGQSGGSSAVWSGRMNPNAAVPASYAPYGIPQAQWDAMSDEEREAFLGRRLKPETVSAAQHQRQVSGLMAASAARAGEASEHDD